MKVQAVVFHWDEDIAKEYAHYVSHKVGCTAIVQTDKGHETALLNQAIAQCDAEFLWFLTPDVGLPDSYILELLLQVFDNPKVGVVLPNRQNDIGVGGNVPYLKYLADGTAMLYRTSVRAHFDEEFIFTGWSDLDFGCEVERRGYEVWVDPRTAVHKQETAYGSWSAFRNAYNARNRLLYEVKWFWPEPGGFGKTNRVSVLVKKTNRLALEKYNNNCDSNKRIPTMFELAWWPEERLQAFADSIYMEHPWVLMKDDDPRGSGNMEWSFE